MLKYETRAPPVGQIKNYNFKARTSKCHPHSEDEIRFSHNDRAVKNSIYNGFQWGVFLALGQKVDGGL